ncbi:DUF2971 domain-containing protein [Zunongwangia sp. HGR-M22]|uniref:DUF2971 domain-containing protein n=1 Tax=Zunongwangia sp. HGR-M22 TaxID=3015168 RepID=UPI0022DE8F08|nr:DUF2971 domain-containing protein [Zunongwangia sp. HGR-M22]WBL24260.1 DUF2971 domain-containing protein [Zunongwangia sp. HGR-M22]
MNDPFECLPQKPSYKEYELAIDEVSKMLISQNENIDISKFQAIVDNLKKQLKQQSKENIRDTSLSDAQSNVNRDIGILSLTKKWNNTLMWSHYSNSHKGFCVGFDPTNKYFDDYINDDGTKSRTKKDVIYSKERAKIPMTLAKRDELGIEPFITKSLDWYYEDEIRVIASLNLHDDIIRKEPMDIYLFKVPHSLIREIIMGVNINEQDEKLITDFCEKRNINLYKTKVSDTKFNMERA